MIIDDDFMDTVFRQVEVGGIFNYSGHVFMKIKPEKDMNVVDLTSNELRKFSDKTVVVPMEGRLKVSAKQN